MRASVSTLLTTVLTVAALFALTGWQVTSEEAATRLLGRLGAAIIEIDRWLPAHQEDLDLVARDRSDGLIIIRDLPIKLTLPTSQVIDADAFALESLMTREIGRVLYEEGNGAFVDSEGDPADLGVTEPLRWTVALLGSGLHGFWTAVLALTTLLLLAAAASVMTTGRTPVHAIAIGALIGVLASLAFWGLMQAASGAAGSAVDEETMLILRDGAWTGVRNCGAAAFAAGVLAFIVNLGRGHSVRRQYSPASRRPGSPFS